LDGLRPRGRERRRKGQSPGARARPRPAKGGAAMTGAVLVFTRDLRVTDHPALAAAVAGARRVVPLFVFDDALLARCEDHANRLGFLLESLADLDRSLRDRGGALVVRRGRWAETVVGVAKEAGAGAIHLSADVSGFAARRRRALAAAAAGAGIGVHEHPGLFVVEPGTGHPPGGAFFRGFTPVYRRRPDAPRRGRGAPPPRGAPPRPRP